MPPGAVFQVSLGLVEEFRVALAILDGCRLHLRFQLITSTVSDGVNGEHLLCLSSVSVRGVSDLVGQSPRRRRILRSLDGRIGGFSRRKSTYLLAFRVSDV